MAANAAGSKSQSKAQPDESPDMTRQQDVATGRPWGQDVAARLAEVHRQLCTPPLANTLRPSHKTAVVALLGLYTCLAWPFLPYDGMGFWDTLVFFAGSHVAPQCLMWVMHMYAPQYILGINGLLSGLWVLWFKLAQPQPFERAVGRIAAVSLGLVGYWLYCARAGIKAWVCHVLRCPGLCAAWATEAFLDWWHSPRWHHHYVWLVEADTDCSGSSSSSSKDLSCSDGELSSSARKHHHPAESCTRTASCQGFLRKDADVDGAAGNCISSSRPQVILRFHPLYGI